MNCQCLGLYGVWILEKSGWSSRDWYLLLGYFKNFKNDILIFSHFILTVNLHQKFIQEACCTIRPEYAIHGRMPKVLMLFPITWETYILFKIISLWDIVTWLNIWLNIEVTISFKKKLLCMSDWGRRVKFHPSPESSPPEDRCVGLGELLQKYPVNAAVSSECTTKTGSLKEK